MCENGISHTEVFTGASPPSLSMCSLSSMAFLIRGQLTSTSPFLYLLFFLLHTIYLLVVNNLLSNFNSCPISFFFVAYCPTSTSFPYTEYLLMFLFFLSLYFSLLISSSNRLKSHSSELSLLPCYFSLSLP